MQSFDKANNWIATDCWLACLDILGFKNLINVVRQRKMGSRERWEYVDNFLQDLNVQGGSTWMSNRSKGWVGN